MPKKKKSVIAGKSIRKQKAKIKRRRNEMLTNEEVQAKKTLAAEKQMIRRRKNNEINVDSENRLANAKRKRKEREKETQIGRKKRKVADAEWHQERRKSASEEEKYLKRTADAERHRVRRENENEEEKYLKRTADAERHRVRRADENEEEKDLNRVANAKRQQVRRADENEEEKDLNRVANAKRQQVRRADENEEEKDFNRVANAKRQRIRRADENEEHKHWNRVADSERKQIKRENENAEEKEQRRLANAARERIRCGKQEEQGKDNRKIQDSEHKRLLRDVQTIAARESRLRNNRFHRKGSLLYNVARSQGIHVDQHSCNLMNISCDLCNGLYFPGEMTTRGKFMRCCHNGKIIEKGRIYPEEFRNLFVGSHPFSLDFFRDIRLYNSLFSFASMGAQVEMPKGSGPYCFRIHGSIYHQTSNLHPHEPGQEKYAQLYILDSDQALRQRMKITRNISLNSNILVLLDTIIRNINPYAQAFKMLRDFEEDTLQEQGAENVTDICMFIKGEHQNLKAGEHRGRYNAPKENEVAVIFKTADGVPPSNRDIVIHPKRGGLINISTLNPNLEPMSYVLFYPYGDKGFEVGKCYSELQFYSHRVSVRRDYFNPVLYGRKLFQQYLVDAYVKVEGNRLSYLKNHQKNLRVETYMGLADHIYRLCQKTGVKPGVPVILPSSFIGSPRCMLQNYQDSMAIVREFGKPDLFITFTCNPKWPEITENLFPGQKPHDRPDIVSRVFDIKKTSLLEDLKKNHVLGITVADMHVIEFQKRGLPHMHLLLILAEDDKIKDSDSIDEVVCAELPDASVHPELHDTVKSSMIHGPCGDLNRNSPCMIDGVCSKGYPKAFQEVSKHNVDGYPLYRRRDNGNIITIKHNVIDNRWVVPYNPYLAKKYNAHINVEVCSSIKSVKYLFKYVYKGHDAAKVVIEESGNSTIVWDEIKNFLNARYVSSPEAVWRIFEKKMHGNSHTIIRLPVHLENFQLVYFTDAEERDALERAAQRNTMLTGWFQLNITTPEANSHLYAEIPKHFTWNKNSYTWQKRVKLGDHILTRMYSVSPKDVERFHLRLLLCHVRGAKSFADLKTYENVVHSTFKEACRARNLLQDDEEWKKCLVEASVFQMPSQLRQLFVFICVFCNPTEPVSLWNKFKESLSEDFAKLYSATESFELTLRSIEDQLKMHSLSLAAFGLPQPTLNAKFIPKTPTYDVEFEMQQAEVLKRMLNDEQKFVYNSVLEAVKDENRNNNKTFCVNAFAGAGKTFLFKTVLHAVRGMGFVAVPVAWTGIAAALLPGGRTVHSTFKLPVPVLENSTCRVKQDSDQGRYLKNAKLIIWDECTMTPHHSLEAVDRLLRDLTGLDVPFGGKTVLLGGDWRQTLPVVGHGNRTSAIENCIRNSSLWPHFKHFTLIKNMRLQPEEQQFSDWLIQLGDGRLGNDSGLAEDLIEIPSSCVINGSLVEEIFGSNDFEDLGNKAILCPKNDETLKLNEEILARFPGQVYTFFSADSIICNNDEEQDTFQIDFIHSLTPSGMPPHCLNLKVGVIIMLLRNLNPSAGLCNGTRLIVKRIMSNVLDCEVLSGHNVGSRNFIPRIELSPSDANLPFQLKRRQFPIRLAFCMTINKSQGQTLRKVGIYLPKPVFSHGMLYVAFSRSTSLNSVKVSVKNTNKQGCLIPNCDKVFAQNVVYREVLQEDYQNYLAEEQMRIKNKVNKEEANTILNYHKSNSNKVFNEIVYREVLKEDSHAYLEQIADRDKSNEQKDVIILSDQKNVLKSTKEKKQIDIREVTENEINILLNPEGYVEDSHMNLFGDIVNSLTPFQMQNVLYLYVPDFIEERSKCNLQILFTNNTISDVGHWICTYYDGHHNHVYDSLNNRFLYSDQKLYLNRLYGFDVVNVFHTVQKQTNQFDCGIFAIAFAVSICSGKDPSNERYVNEEMRNHAVTIFKNKLLFPFPTK